MASNYKLTYFEFRGLAEPSRLAFAYAGVPFEDVRIARPDWPAIKSSFLWESLPVLEFDGNSLAQSSAILRYLGKEFSLVGENAFETAKCDEIIETMADLRAGVMKFWIEENEDKKAELKATLMKDTLPKILTKWSQILDGNNGFFVGKKLSIADFCIASFLEGYDGFFELDIAGKYPAIHAHQELVFKAPGIIEWVVKRPKTDF